MKSLPFHGIILLEKSEHLQAIDGTVHVALCAMAAEAFLQDIKSYYQAISALRPYTPSRTILNMNPEPRYFGGGISINGRMEYLSPNERELESLIDDLEWESLVEKYEKIIRLLDGTWNKGGDESFKNLRRLIKLRNNLVHIKSDEIELGKDQSISEHPRVVHELLRLKVLDSNMPMTSWIYMLDTEKLVSWARRAVIDIMNNMLGIMPNYPISNNFKSSYSSSLKTFDFT